jgi:pimeloyl-ACP methyl ester carboxylesterase
MTVLDPGAGLTERIVTLPDGRRIRTVLGGPDDGSAVVFEAGLSAPAACWLHTQREISAYARTISYDRAGYGGSDVDAADRTLERIVDDLGEVLDALDVTAPAVFVGHSWGGPILRLFADRYPQRVAGLVFIDASLAEAMPGKNARLIQRTFAAMAVLARFGGKGLIRRLTVPHGLSPQISDADAAIMWRDYLSPRAMKAGSREGAQIRAALPTLRRLQAAGTPDVPVVCVQGGRVDRGMATLRPILNDTAHTLMSAATNGSVIVVDRAGHLVPQEQPAEVREAILGILAASKVSGR